jgi:hypothetical protein
MAMVTGQQLDLVQVPQQINRRGQNKNQENCLTFVSLQSGKRKRTPEAQQQRNMEMKVYRRNRKMASMRTQIADQNSQVSALLDGDFGHLPAGVALTAASAVFRKQVYTPFNILMQQLRHPSAVLSFSSLELILRLFLYHASPAALCRRVVRFSSTPSDWRLEGLK